MNIKPPYYFGGIAPEVKEGKHRKKFMRNVDSVSSGFVGCMRDFKQKDTRLENKEAPVELGTSLCSGDSEDGTYFGAKGGYIKLFPTFRVGLDLIVRFSMRARTTDGVIFAVQSATKPDFMMLQMKDGNLIFSANNGKEDIFTRFEPDEKHHLCDGNWHEIEAVKAKNVVTLTIDEDDFPMPGIGTAGISDTDTDGPLYIGGVPDGEYFPALETTEDFVGCIRNFRFEDQPQSLTGGEAEIFYDVSPNTCPAA